MKFAKRNTRNEGNNTMKKEKKTGFRILAFLLMLFLFYKSENVNFHASAYTGIQIDGDFSDWDNELKTIVNDEFLHSVAFILDGDFMYIYVDAKEQWRAYGVGAHFNGKYTVTTDLGYQMIFQMKDGGNWIPQIDGVNGAVVAHSDVSYGHTSYKYEIAIPVTELPLYNESISFGFYLQEPVITGVVNRQGHQTGEQETIVCDGSFSDWDYYPHPVIYYGIDEDGYTFVEGQAAVYSSGEKLYAHIFSAMKQHIENGGKDLVTGLMVSVNSPSGESTEGNNFLPKLVSVDADGILHETEFANLQQGVHEFVIVDMGGWPVDGYPMDYWSDPDTYWYNGNAVYGKAYVRISPSYCEMEFELDIETLGDKFGLSPNELTFFGVKFQSVGGQWVTCAGASSGPWIGVAVSGLAVLYVLWRRRMKATVNG